ncbi:hypothetical protein [Actinocorallia aurantiaca]|uniref:Uncharacterized protein n=1 Tax=Actinocorallia aurantiaca TaxID=46204 RepID=A0ABN3UBX2_9ACTN
MATRTGREHGATAEETRTGGLPSLTEEERTSRLASKGAAISAGVLIIATLLPWVSVTFFSAATLSGVRIWEGRITLILAFLAGAAALAALYWRELSRNTLLLVSAVCGVLAFISTVIFGFRFRDALNIPAILGDTQALVLANAGVGLDTGWYLAMASGIALAALSIWGYLESRGERPSESVPGMEWVEPGTHQSPAQGAGDSSQSTGPHGSSPGERG